jgi:DNA-binding MarR family transcriptional regulator
MLALLHVPLQMLTHQVQDDLAASGYSDLGPAHFNVLPHLRPRGSRLTDLAQRAQISKQAMNYLIDHLERQGYVERVADPGDGRARVVCLTERGRELSQATWRSLDQIQTKLADRLGKSEIHHLRRLLLELSRALQG